MRRTFVVVIITLGLAATSCGLFGGSEILAACGGPTDDADRSLGDVDGVELTFDAETYAPGARAKFSWTLDRDPDTITTGDEWTVECWDGTRWKNAWMAMAVYDDAFFQYLDDEFGVTTDGFGPEAGAVVIPDDAPAGLYRVSPWSDQETGASVEALFEVAAP